LENPAWSTDGKWIAFANNGQIFKMSFDGQEFDTIHINQLTNDNASHFFPAWSPNSDTIYFDSDENDVSAPYQVYKMSASGGAATRIGNKGPDSVFSREPFCTNGNQILHIRGDVVSTHVFTMNTNGDSVKQLTTNISPHIYIHNPRLFNSKIYYEDYGIWSSNTDGSLLQQIGTNSTQGFSISNDGTIAYINLDITDNSPNSIIDSTHGVIWLMKSDGTAKRQFTYNHYK